MSIATPPTAPKAAPLVDRRRYRLSAERYYRIAEAGILNAKDPVFLWKGGLVEKMTKNPPHNIASTCLNRLLVCLVPDGWYVAIEQPVAITNDSVPEPDLTVVRGTPRDYSRRPPTAQDVAMVVEVSDSSLADDQGEMLEAYARQAIPVYWIVNIPQRRIEVHTDPTGPAGPAFYRSPRYYGPDDEVPVVLDGREVGRVAVRDVMP